ncbi:MAG: hypothetical protein ACFFG0_02785 [Candidatus Thorarchaeota archaeon]
MGLNILSVICFLVGVLSGGLLVYFCLIEAINKIEKAYNKYSENVP